MPLKPSRHPLRHPLAAADLAAFTHPRCPVLGQVVKHPATGIVMAANGCIALHLDRGPILHDDRIPTACPAFTRRIESLPWSRFQPDPNRLTPHEWRALDPERGSLYRHGLEELWIRKGKGIAMTKSKPVWTAQAILIPLAILQLVARLPRVELRIDHAADFALIRFSGGTGLIANRYRAVRPCDIPAHIFSLFHRPADRLQGGLGKLI